MCVISVSQTSFIISQICLTKRKKQGKRWTIKHKSLALSLLHSSPKTYRLLQKIFCLPSIDTLKRVMKNINVVEGFNEEILSALSLKVKNMPKLSKYVCLVYDEMSIKEGISYDGGHDRVEGFTKEKHLANHALVFVARGIFV